MRVGRYLHQGASSMRFARVESDHVATLHSQKTGTAQISRLQGRSRCADSKTGCADSTLRQRVLPAWWACRRRPFRLRSCSWHRCSCRCASSDRRSVGYMFVIDAMTIQIWVVFGRLDDDATIQMIEHVGDNRVLTCQQLHLTRRYRAQRRPHPRDHTHSIAG